jgi:hypothetical protein
MSTKHQSDSVGRTAERSGAGKLKGIAASDLAMRPVSKHGSISLSQASRAVRAYRDGSAAKKK